MISDITYNLLVVDDDERIRNLLRQYLINQGFIVSTASGSEEARNKIIADIDGVIAGTEPYDAEVLNAAEKLKVISRVGVGLDNIDFICNYINSFS